MLFWGSCYIVSYAYGHISIAIERNFQETRLGDQVIFFWITAVPVQVHD